MWVPNEVWNIIKAYIQTFVEVIYFQFKDYGYNGDHDIKIYPQSMLMFAKTRKLIAVIVDKSFLKNYLKGFDSPKYMYTGKFPGNDFLIVREWDHSETERCFKLQSIYKFPGVNALAFRWRLSDSFVYGGKDLSLDLLSSMKFVFVKQ